MMSMSTSVELYVSQSEALKNKVSTGRFPNQVLKFNESDEIVLRG